MIKRSLYLCSVLFTHYRVDKIIFACNTLSLISLGIIKDIFKNVYGVFDSLLPYIDDNSILIGSRKTVSIVNELFPNVLTIDGSELIKGIEYDLDYYSEINKINNLSTGKTRVILACTHFLKLDDSLFVLPTVKNKLLLNNKT